MESPQTIETFTAKILRIEGTVFHYRLGYLWILKPFRKIQHPDRNTDRIFKLPTFLLPELDGKARIGDVLSLTGYFDAKDHFHPIIQEEKKS